MYCCWRCFGERWAAVKHGNRAATIWWTAPIWYIHRRISPPFAGTWQNADESIVLEIEGIGQLEASRMNLTVDGVVKLTSDMWVYKTGYVKLTEGYNDVLLPEPFQLLEFFHSLDAFCLYTTEGETFMLARPGVESQRILSFRH